MPFEYDQQFKEEWMPAAIPLIHDPSRRDCMLKLVGWQIRVIMRNDNRHTPMAAQGLLHLQLWHPGTKTSVLTPSNFTDRKFELWNEQMHVQVDNYQRVNQIIASNIGIHMPCAALIHHYQCWLVWAPCIGVIHYETANQSPKL